MKKRVGLIWLCLALLISGQAQNGKPKQMRVAEIKPGAWKMQEYLPLLTGKRVAVFANNTALVNGVHLVDTLQKRGVRIVRIFGPEHGFRGTAGAGEKVLSYTDEKTGIPVVSLYGKKRKLNDQDVADVDVLLFDIQDVGTRFYTYISSLQDYMESAWELGKPLIVLDRPNPNGFYVDGPVLDTAYKSFVGMQPVPVVYGMTIGEYARFLVGEHLLQEPVKKPVGKLSLTIVRCDNYTHNSRYVLPVRPSPNLPDMGSINWYPSTCLFEGTALSEGRGTPEPFQIFGHPSLPDTLFAFTPQISEGAPSPKLNGVKCFGWNLTGKKAPAHIDLTYLLRAYELFAKKDSFFITTKSAKTGGRDYVFDRLAGSSRLRQQIVAGKSEAEIRASWQPALTGFKKKRKKYLLYPDFE